MSYKQKNEWLLLMHQLPPQPDSFRVKIWRQLQRAGAISLKNSVYVLPNYKETLATLERIASGIQRGGGEAFLCKTNFIQGVNLATLVRKFNSDRNNVYRKISKSTAVLVKLARNKLNSEKLMKIDHSIGKLRRQLSENIAVDFFSANERKRAESLVHELEKMILGDTTISKLKPVPRKSIKDYQAKTWVTRKNVFVDRMASAWLIGRFIDQKPRFLFVNANDYKRKNKNEFRFDMHDGEFTHHGDLSTFETLIKAFQIRDPALIPIAEIIHDIDLKDEKYNREEMPGIQRIITGIVQTEFSDESRISRASALFNELYSTFKTNRKKI